MSVYFNGSNSYGEFPFTFQGLTSFTFEAWIKTTQNDSHSSPWGNPAIFGCKQASGTINDFVLSNKSGILTWWDEIGGGEYSTGYVINTGEWLHIAVVRDGGNLSFYVNGVKVGQHRTHATEQLTRPLELGRALWSNSKYFEGLMSEVRLWSSARTEQEIADNYNKTFNDLDDLDLLGYWRFLDESNLGRDESQKNNLVFYNIESSEDAPPLKQHKILLLSEDKKVKTLEKISKQVKINDLINNVINRTSDVYRGVAENLFDEEKKDFVSTTTSLRVDIELKRKSAISEISIEPSNNDNINRVVLQGSNDFETWINVIDISGLNFREKTFFKTNIKNKYKYYRFIIYSSGWTYVNNIEIFEKINSIVVERSGDYDFEHGMSLQYLPKIDFSSEFTEKHYIQNQSTSLGSGKVFKQPLDIDKIIESVKIE